MTKMTLKKSLLFFFTNILFSQSFATSQLPTSLTLMIRQARGSAKFDKQVAMAGAGVSTLVTMISTTVAATSGAAAIIALFLCFFGSNNVNFGKYSVKALKLCFGSLSVATVATIIAFLSASQTRLYNYALAAIDEYAVSLRVK